MVSLNPTPQSAQHTRRTHHGIRTRRSRRATAITAVIGICTGLFSTVAPMAHAEPAAAAPSALSTGNAPTAAAMPSSPFLPIPWGNDPECTPPPKHPNPVVLVPGTWAGSGQYAALGIRLHNAGMCVYSLVYGQENTSLPGKFLQAKQDAAMSVQTIDPQLSSEAALPQGATGDMHTSTEQLHSFVNTVLHNTAAGRAAGAVDLVGHSQGGAIIRMMLGKYPDLPVRHVVTIGGTNHGTTMMGVTNLPVRQIPHAMDAADLILGVAPVQQMANSDTVAALDALPDTVPGIRYTVITSMGDTVSTPYYLGFLKASPGATVDNVVVQERCGLPLTTGHNDMHKDPAVARLIVNVLSDHPATCS